MISELALLPSGRAVRRWDDVAVVCVVVSVALDMVAGMQLWSLAGLHRGRLGAAHEGLAAAELRQLGVRPPVEWPQAAEPRRG